MVGGRAEGRRRRPTVAIALRGLREGPRAACARGSQDSGTALAMHASDPRQEREKRRRQRHAPKKCHKRVTAPPPNRRKLVPPLPQPQSPPAQQARSQLISGSALVPTRLPHLQRKGTAAAAPLCHINTKLTIGLARQLARLREVRISCVSRSSLASAADEWDVVVCFCQLAVKATYLVADWS